MQKLKVAFQHLGKMNYQQAWDYQEKLMQENLEVKKNKRLLEDGKITEVEFGNQKIKNHFLLVEHPPVFTLGKSGAMENLLVNNDFLKQQGIEFFKTNRGGDITFHGPEQIVGYPILDLEMLKPDLVVYMRNLEEVIIRTLAEYGLQCERSEGETGVWLDVKDVWKARKICAMGVRTSRWITMHGFALNVNTDLKYFEMIIPCGIENKQVTTLEKELGRKIPLHEVEEKIKKHFEDVFGVELV
ncbi:MAG: lipoyl(octanoyl) transferase LipB [Chitinophagaceae bacterium]|nr:lipoyl(octanoyl) transferase LipB [Chitinophagaceae bacterium]